MATRFDSERHQLALSTPTGYRRFSQFTFSRNGVTLELEPVSGRITQDARRAGRWDGQLTFAGDSIIPQEPGDLLTPFGTRVTAVLGLELLDGSVSTVPYGTFSIGSSRTRIDAGTRVVDVGLIDVSDRVDRYRFESPLTFSSGTDLAEMANTLILDRTGFSPGLSDLGETLSSMRTYGLEAATPPWAELLDVLKGYNLTAWYDRVGDVQIASVIPDENLAYSVDDGLTSLSADFDTRPPNVIVVRGESQTGSTPVFATAVDSDPSSPTYAGTGPGTSPYGRVTEYYSSPLLDRGVPGVAQAVANTLLARRVGGGATYTLVRPYDPTITAADVVSQGGRVFAVDSVTVNLAGETTIQAREL